jgi:predicted lipid-binding transport protein (Tim44 family)
MKKTVTVTFDVEVTVDETKFTPEFMENFRKYFAEFEDLDEHMEHIATLAAREMLDDFTEGYGELSSMGIKAKVTDVMAEVEG